MGSKEIVQAELVLPVYTLDLPIRREFEERLARNELLNEDLTKGRQPRCIAGVWQKDSNGEVNKSLPKKRCSRPIVEGSVYCTRHGGGLSTLTHGRFSKRISRTLGRAFDEFITDPAINNLEAEISMIRVIIKEYLEKLQEARKKPAIARMKSLRSAVKRIKRMIANAEEEAEGNLHEKQAMELVMDIRAFLLRDELLTDRGSMKMINETLDTLSKLMERWRKIERDDKFTMDIGGVRVLLTNIVAVIRKHVRDDKALEKISEDIQKIPFKSTSGYSR